MRLHCVNELQKRFNSRIQIPVKRGPDRDEQRLGISNSGDIVDDVKVLASIGAERIPLTPDAPTVGEVAPALDVSLWNGLFVHKDTPADVREKIVAVAQKVVTSDAAKQLAEDTGALIYWQNAEESAAQIEADTETLGTISSMLE